MNQSPIFSLAENLKEKHPVVLATVIRTQGASPAKVGAQLVRLSDGHIIGTIGGGKLEASIISDAAEVIQTGQACVNHYCLAETGEDAIGTLCGGELDVFFQPYLPPPQLVIVGGGHIGKPLKIMGEAAGFEVIVVDVEPGRADISCLESIDLSLNSYVVLITTDHVSDEAALRYALTTSARYIGMIGSRHKCETILEHLRKDGFREEALARVYAPIGFDLGGPTPGEIAAGVLAEIIAVRRKGRGGSRSR